MKRLAFILAALMCGSAYADDMVARNGEDVVRLTQEVCPPEILALLQPELRERVRAAQSIVSGKDYRACWMALPNGFVGLVYEDGDEGRIPQREFKQSSGV